MRGRNPVEKVDGEHDAGKCHASVLQREEGARAMVIHVEGLAPSSRIERATRAEPAIRLTSGMEENLPPDMPFVRTE
jgi:hypothetical protein